MNGKRVYWAFCCWKEQQGRTARGFVLASNEHDAMKKARKRVVVEKRRAAMKMGLPAGSVPSVHRRGRYGVRVWKDPDKATAPREARHYTERMEVK